MLNLRFLGTFHVTFSDGYEPTIGTAKAKALLAYLVTESDRPHLREQLAALFWPEADQKAALQSLRQALYALKRQLQPVSPASSSEDLPSLTITRQDVAFNFDSDHWSDVAMFTAFMRTVQQHVHQRLDACPECIARLEEAVDLYKGEFLTGLSLPDADGFEGWRLSRQEWFRAQTMRALGTIADFYERRRDYGAAQRFLMRLLDLEPWDEESHRRLIRLLALDNQRTAAIQQFESTRRLLEQELGVEPSPDTVQLVQRIQRGESLVEQPEIGCPYKGLYPFSLADNTDFYGREETVHYLLQRLEQQPAVFLIGSSGSGKSSVVHAGVFPVLLSIRQIPALAASGAGAASEEWSIVELRPGADPFRSLAEAIARLPKLRVDIAELVQRLSRDGASLPDLDLLPRRKRTLLFVDQFEELYTLCDSPSVRRMFVDLLLNSVVPATDGASPISLMISLRADFVSQALTHRPLADVLQHGGIVLGPMGRNELRCAIEEPARNRGVLFEPGLVDRLLDDVGEEPGNLPLLQFALSELWTRRQGWQITHDTYDTIGRVAGALASYADQVYQQLSADEQMVARRLFVQLVQPGDETGDTRRPALRLELGEPAWELARKLADLRLVVTGRNDGGESVELVHEALIRNWLQLHEWMDEDRDFRRWQQRLRTFLHQWLASDCESDALLRGLLLSEAERWVEMRRAELSRFEREFIDASIQTRNQHLAELDSARQQELERAQHLAATESQRAEVEHKTSLRLRWLTVALTTAMFLAMGAAVVAAISRYEAQQSALQALARQLAAQAINFADGSTALALLLNVEALARMTGQDDRTGLLTTFPISPLLDRYFWGGSGDITQIAVTPDGERILTVETSGAEGSVRLWDSSTGRALSMLIPPAVYGAITVAPTGALIATAEDAAIQLWDGVGGEPAGALSARIATTDTINSLQFTEDGERLLAKTINGVVMMWDVRSLEEAVRFLIPDGREAATVSPNGLLVAITQDIGEERGVNLWRTDTGQPTGVRLGGHTSNIGNVVFTQDSQKAVTVSFDGTARVWDTRSGGLLYGPLNDHAGRVLSAAFSPDGRILATGGADRRIYLYDIVKAKMIGESLTGHNNWVRSLRFNWPGTALYSSATAGSLIRWEMTRRQLFEGHTSRVRAVALSPDGSMLATVGFDRRILLWDAQSGRKTAELASPHENSLLQVAFSPDGRFLATSDAGGLIVLWDAATGERLHLLPDEFDSVVIALAFSPDSRYLASTDFLGYLSLWDVSTGAPASVPTKAHDGWALSAAFSPDGRMLATGGEGGRIKLWDVSSLGVTAGEPLQALGEPIAAHTYWVTALLWSGDGATLISGSADNTVRFWDVAKGEQQADPLINQETQIWGIQFYPPHGERSLITLGGNGSVLLWDIATRTPLAPALRTGLETESFAVSPPGDAIYLASFDDRVEKWRLDTLTWPQRSCEMAARALSEEEWRHFLDDAPYQPLCAPDSIP